MLASSTDLKREREDKNNPNKGEEQQSQRDRERWEGYGRKNPKKERKESERRNKSIEKENISGLRKAPHLWLRSPETIIWRFQRQKVETEFFS